MKKNFYLDLLLFFSGLTCILTELIIDFHLFTGGKAVKVLLTDIHIYSGYAMSIALIFHLIWHWKWVRAVSSQLTNSSK